MSSGHMNTSFSNTNLSPVIGNEPWQDDQKLTKDSELADSSTMML